MGTTSFSSNHVKLFADVWGREEKIEGGNALSTASHHHQDLRSVLTPEEVAEAEIIYENVKLHKQLNTPNAFENVIRFIIRCTGRSASAVDDSATAEQWRLTPIRCRRHDGIDSAPAYQAKLEQLEDLEHGDVISIADKSCSRQLEEALMKLLMPPKYVQSACGVPYTGLKFITASHYVLFLCVGSSWEMICSKSGR